MYSQITAASNWPCLKLNVWAADNLSPLYKSSQRQIFTHVQKAVEKMDPAIKTTGKFAVKNDVWLLGVSHDFQWILNFYN